MCPPEFFGVDYVINPWMSGNIGSVRQVLAAAQWTALYNALSEHAIVKMVDPVKGLPDMVFTANAGIRARSTETTNCKTVVVSTFKEDPRKPEAAFFKQWFDAEGYDAVYLDAGLTFEGAGDALFDAQDRLWVGYGFRSMSAAAPQLAQRLGTEHYTLRLVDARFYHLDMAFCPLNNGSLLYYPGAFDRPSRELIVSKFAAQDLIAVADADARRFVCNAVNIDGKLITNAASDDARRRIGKAGYAVIEIDVSEFIKAGGACKCLSMEI